MDYTTIYEFTPRTSNLFHLAGILLFVLAGFGLSYYTKLYDKKFSFKRQFKIFFGYLLGGIALIIFIVMIINIPKIISYERELKQIVENKDFVVAQGEIEKFSPQSENNNFESFTVKGVKFEYSDYVIIDGFHQSSKNGGPFRENGQQVRISYIVRDGVNLIMKIEINP